MPIKITCEHCANDAAYNLRADTTDDTITIRPKVIVAPIERHICDDPACLVKEIEARGRSFDDHFAFRRGGKI